MEIPNKRELQPAASNNLSDKKNLSNKLTKDTYSFLVNVIPLSSDNLSQFRKNLFWIWALGRKPKHSVTNLKKNKAQYALDRQAAKISDLSPGNVSQYESLTATDLLLEVNLIPKALKIKRFKYLLCKELKKETSSAEKHYQKFDNDFETSKKEQLKTKKQNKLC